LRWEGSVSGQMAARPKPGNQPCKELKPRVAEQAKHALL